jgi:hypothetical protein
VQETGQRVLGARRSVWQRVLKLLRTAGPVSAQAVKQHLVSESPELICGVLHDLVHSGLARRRGWGERAMYSATAKAESLALSGELGSSEPEGQISVARQCG